VGKNGIFLQLDQTRKGLPADTIGNEQGRQRNRRSTVANIKQDALRRARLGSPHSSKGSAIMRTSHLRVYYGPQEESTDVRVADGKIRESVNVPLMEILPLLSDAVRSDRTWLRDFADDEVNISMDLYEVLLAYQHYRRPSA
jgi:hypothetical protein